MYEIDYFIDHLIPNTVSYVCLYWKASLVSQHADFDIKIHIYNTYWYLSRPEHFLFEEWMAFEAGTGGLVGPIITVSRTQCISGIRLYTFRD